MSCSRIRRICGMFSALILCSIIIPISLDARHLATRYSQVGMVSGTFQDIWDPTGPYVDRVVFHIINDPDRQISALIQGEIDHVTEGIEYSYFQNNTSNVTWTFTPGLGYRNLLINCGRYPYSIPAFRRALAFAVDKEEVASIMYGEYGTAENSPVLPACGIWHNPNTHLEEFLQANITRARAELIAAGFLDLNGDGFVEAPDGSTFVFQPMYPIEILEWEEAMTSMKHYWDLAGIPTAPLPRTFSTIIDTLYTIDRNYDAAGFWFGTSPDPLALQTWTSYQIPNPEGNIINWSNTTFDYWVDIMTINPDYDTVLEAAHKAQEIIVEDVPILVLCSNQMMNAHRTDRFEGWINSPGYGVSGRNYWTPRKVRLLPDQSERDPYCGVGGVFHTMIGSAMDSQNPLTSISVYGQYPLSQIYVSLTGLSDPYDHSPTFGGGGISYYWEVHEESDCLRFDFTLYGADGEHSPAYWHDMGGSSNGMVTAEDVKFSYDYIAEHLISRYLRGIIYYNSCEIIDDFHVSIRTKGKSYWAFDKLRQWSILPKHIWQAIADPTTFRNSRPVGCGPFKWDHRIAGEYIELSFWNLYHEGVWCNGDPPPPPYYLPLVLTAGGVIIIATVIGCLIYLYTPTSTRRTKGDIPTPETRPFHPPSGAPHPCSQCGTPIYKEDRFCPGCGHPQENVAN